MSYHKNTAETLKTREIQALRAALKGKVREDGVVLTAWFRGRPQAEHWADAIRALGGEVWSVVKVGKMRRIGTCSVSLTVKMTFSVGMVEDLYLAGRETLAGARELAEYEAGSLRYGEENMTPTTKPTNETAVIVPIMTAPTGAVGKAEWDAFAARVVCHSCNTFCTVEVSVRGDEALRSLQRALEKIDPDADREDNGTYGLLYEGMDDDDDTWSVLIRYD